MSKIRPRQKEYIKTGAYGAAAMLILCLGVGFAMYSVNRNNQLQDRAAYEKKIKDAEQLLNEQRPKQTGFILKDDLKAGDVIKESNLLEKNMPDYVIPGNFITKKQDVIGKTIKINSFKNTLLTSDMLFAKGPLDASQRKMEVDFVRLPYRLVNSDTIDIKIIYPNGEDYVVVAKKQINDLDQKEQMIYFDANSEEILLLDSALVDAYINNAEIYAIQYVDPTIQPAPAVNYLPNNDILKVIKMDPDIVNKARYDLSDKLRQSLDDRLKTSGGNSGAAKPRIGADLPTGSAVSKRGVKACGPRRGESQSKYECSGAVL
ncbi:SAF domain-containing protein [Paenibacillus cremeus]|uniref:SAF domain-containing protein n=1 Tax=Paenibacillus cremeus TaxID=2163881 RepID=A0A559K5A0_9BACL|nr:SAF domain-containing protein [Paenibacillus cremeus]TVY07315.1 hypothetical protein FPZ49_24540 [Paenibacillus cremeus]